MAFVMDLEKMCAWLKEVGIPADNVRRVVIDISVDDAAMVYIEQYGEESILDVTPPKVGWRQRVPGDT